MIYFYLSCVWIPAQDPAVLPAAQEQLGISQAPGDGQNTPVHEEQFNYQQSCPLGLQRKLITAFEQVCLPCVIL